VRRPLDGREKPMRRHGRCEAIASRTPSRAGERSAPACRASAERRSNDPHQFTHVRAVRRGTLHATRSIP
jgi:hypothetical protein